MKTIICEYCGDTTRKVTDKQRACGKSDCQRQRQVDARRRYRERKRVENAVYIDCSICGASARRIRPQQVTCLAEDCKREQVVRARRRAWERERATRPAPICRWCGEPNHEKGKRLLYHAECKADKNRERVREYNRGRGTSPRKTGGKPRKYKGTVVCIHCETEVPRKAARQVTCASRKCQQINKRLRKAEASERKRLLAEFKEKRRVKSPGRAQPTIAVRLEYPARILA